MSSFFGINSDSSSSFFNSYFGSSSSTSGSVSMGDYALIKSGAYKKLLNKYYKENGDSSSSSSTIKTSAAADTTTNLLTTKNSAKNVVDSAKTLSDGDYTSENRESLLKDVKNLVSNYNTLVESMGNIESTTILQNGVWMTNQTKENSSVLADAGITIGADNTLTIDETKFKAASEGKLKTLFSGNNSVVGTIAKRASSIYTTAGTQALLNDKKSSYSNTGGYNTISTSKLFDSLL